MSLRLVVVFGMGLWAVGLGSCSGDDTVSGTIETGCDSNSDCAPGEACQEGMCVTLSVAADTGVGTSDVADNPQDAGADEDVRMVGVGDSCDDGEDCPSGFCIEAAGAAGRRVCTDFCDPSDAETCPDGYSCAAVSNSGADVTFLCFPEMDVLCMPCNIDSDCGGLSDLCLEYQDGTFCARDCQLQACPEGYSCAELEGPNGELVSQCQPDGGICSDCFDPDNDEHGLGPGCLGLDCDENNPDINAGAFELCNGEDDNCNAQTDEGYALDTDPLNCGACGEVCSFEGAEALCVDSTCQPGDCLENRYDIDGRLDNGCEYFCEPSQDGLEVCNGRDDDCDGEIDDGNPGGGMPCETGGEGICAPGILRCVEGGLVCDAEEGSRAESCNGLDDDCDGEVDNGNPGGGAACNTGLEGICNDGTLICTEGEVSCVQLREATDEVCNGRDDNCNGTPDEGNPGGGAACDTGEEGVCLAGTLRCLGGELMCDRDQDPLPESCNGHRSCRR
ncbi:MAG: putative metal-binding motif-containing protein, partial [Myxococcota bacterium]